MRLLLVRHGETKENVKSIFPKFSPDINSGPDLTKKGIKQAEGIAKRLKNRKIDAIYCSSRKRTIHTTKIINKHHKIKINIMKGLRDMDFGVLAGKSSITEKLPKRLRETNIKRKNDDNYSIPRGESFIDTKKRVGKAIKRIIKKKKENVLIVSHRNTMRTIYACLFNLNQKQACKINKYLTVGSFLEIDLNGKPKLIKKL